eukprot:gnl/Dysnectes_brevis/3473_a4402_696.p1 GENE.gnl/Dysnectes_brevis/3473_a4402_696~~gnl/Dysnectes_brevis/3473_a4402_696.p1  ORF type:complete len:475 (+),score=140.02 gnl/Dysnectes_brevis/3473_a4402_696:63-1427(+)
MSNPSSPEIETVLEKPASPKANSELGKKRKAASPAPKKRPVKKKVTMLTSIPKTPTKRKSKSQGPFSTPKISQSTKTMSPNPKTPLKTPTKKTTASKVKKTPQKASSKSPKKTPKKSKTKTPKKAKPKTPKPPKKPTEKELKRIQEEKAKARLQGRMAGFLKKTSSPNAKPKMKSKSQPKTSSTPASPFKPPSGDGSPGPASRRKLLFFDAYETFKPSEFPHGCRLPFAPPREGEEAPTRPAHHPWDPSTGIRAAWQAIKESGRTVPDLPPRRTVINFGQNRFRPTLYGSAPAFRGTSLRPWDPLARVVPDTDYETSLTEWSESGEDSVISEEDRAQDDGVHNPVVDDGYLSEGEGSLGDGQGAVDAAGDTLDSGATDFQRWYGDNCKHYGPNMADALLLTAPSGHPSLAVCLKPYGASECPRRLLPYQPHFLKGPLPGETEVCVRPLAGKAVK